MEAPWLASVTGYWRSMVAPGRPPVSDQGRPGLRKQPTTRVYPEYAQQAKGRLSEQVLPHSRAPGYAKLHSPWVHCPRAPGHRPHALVLRQMQLCFPARSLGDAMEDKVLETTTMLHLRPEQSGQTLGKRVSQRHPEGLHECTGGGALYFERSALTLGPTRVNPKSP